MLTPVADSLISVVVRTFENCQQKLPEMILRAPLDTFEGAPDAIGIL